MPNKSKIEPVPVHVEVMQILYRDDAFGYIVIFKGLPTVGFEYRPEREAQMARTAKSLVMSMYGGEVESFTGEYEYDIRSRTGTFRMTFYLYDNT